MEEIIKFRVYFLRKAFVWLAIISIPLCVCLFLWMRIDFIYSYTLSMLFVFTGLVWIFYYNRHTPEVIKLKGDEFEITFFNKLIFKKQQCTCEKQEIEPCIKGENLEIYKDKTLLVKMHRNTVDDEEWDKLKVYFTL